MMMPTCIGHGVLAFVDIVVVGVGFERLVAGSGSIPEWIFNGYSMDIQTRAFVILHVNVNRRQMHGCV